MAGGALGGVFGAAFRLISGYTKTGSGCRSTATRRFRSPFGGVVRRPLRPTSGFGFAGAGARRPSNERPFSTSWWQRHLWASIPLWGGDDCAASRHGPLHRRFLVFPPRTAGRSPTPTPPPRACATAGRFGCHGRPRGAGRLPGRRGHPRRHRRGLKTESQLHGRIAGQYLAGLALCSRPCGTLLWSCLPRGPRCPV